jgi:branched-chain amino acid transport system substrate-binding protein
MKKRRLFVFAVVVAILTPLTVGYAAETIKIGALYTMTGRGGQYGKDSEVAIKMAVDEVNAKGLPGGKKLEVAITDDKNPQYAVSVAKR